jgi:hypothetical protein
MGLIISVSRLEAVKTEFVHDELSRFCERIFERDESFVYIPLPGKLIEVLRLLKECGIVYELKNDVT